MPRFQYVAMNAKGKEVKGVLDGATTIEVINKLHEKGLFPTTVTEVTAKAKKQKGIKGAAGEQPKSLKEKLERILQSGKVSSKIITIFSRQLAVLIDAGLPLLRSLNAIQEQEKNPTLKRTIKELSESVEGGSTFSEALAQFPKIFSKLFVNMVKAGEAGGVLDVVLNRLAEFSEKAQRLKAKVKSAMIYPILVLVFAFGILTFLITVIVPKFADMFFEMDIELPGMTLMLIGLSEFIQHRWYILVFLVVLIIVLFRYIYKSERGRFYIDTLKLRLPLFGSLLTKVAIARFTRTLGTLLSSGVPILQALNIVRDTVGNEVIARAVTNVHDCIREGESIVGPLKANKVFPAMVVSMVDVGEETGNLSEMLNKIADTYDEEVDVAVEGLTSILEPLMIITLAFIVGFIVIAMFLPLVKLMQSI